jgi:hypothetical protein
MVIGSGKIGNLLLLYCLSLLSFPLSSLSSLYASKDEQVWLRTGSREFLKSVIKRDGWLPKKNSSEGDRMG